MQYIGYLAFRFVVFLFWLLPFSAMYRLSNGVAWMLRVVIGYRKGVVYKQLRASFPDKSAAEIDRLARASYLNLSDILLESIIDDRELSAHTQPLPESLELPQSHPQASSTDQPQPRSP